MDDETAIYVRNFTQPSYTRVSDWMTFRNASNALLAIEGVLPNTNFYLLSREFVKSESMLGMMNA